MAFSITPKRYISLFHCFVATTLLQILFFPLSADTDNPIIAARRNYIDKMRNVLTMPYEGYDIIIITSSTPEEASHQQISVENVFDGVVTSNTVLSNKVCILSIFDEAEGGQIIGQINSWRKAVEAFEQWKQFNHINIVETLDDLHKESAVKIATYHNGGKAERFSPASISFNLSRADQPLVGSVQNAKGEKIQLNLLAAVLLSTSAFASNCPAGSMDVYWTNQLGFGTSNLDRAECHLNKFAVKVPVNPNGKDLYDYGTFIVADNGNLLKFLANKNLTEKDASTGIYVRSQKNGKDYDELLSAAKEGKAFFDFGSFNMSNAFDRALYDYWVNVKGIFDIMELNADHKAGISRDIDPALIQILVTLVNGMNGKKIPQELPSQLFLREKEVSSYEKGQILANAYQKFLKIMDSEYRIALEAFYAKNQHTVLETFEFFLLNLDKEIFKDLTKVIGYIDLGTASYWLAYKRLLDMANEKFLMLADIIDHTMEIDTKGEILTQKADIADKVKAEDIRMLRGIPNNSVACFKSFGKTINLSAEEMREGRFIRSSGDKAKERDTSYEGVWVKGSIIQGDVELLAGSSIEYSVINDSQGKIRALNSYVELSTAPVILAENSILIKVIDLKEVSANKEIVADAFRSPEDLKDEGMPPGQTRMRAPVGYDPKPADKDAPIQDSKKFAPNQHSFQEVRNMPCNRKMNDEVECALRKAARHLIRGCLLN